MLSPESTAHILASTPFFWADQTSNSPAWTVDAVTSVKGLATTSLIFCWREAQAVWFPAQLLRTTVVQCSSVCHSLRCTCKGLQ